MFQPINLPIAGLLLNIVFSNSLLSQTKLDSSQLPQLQGSAQGSFSSTKLRDVNSAVDHGNGATNAIATSIADCGTNTSCSIVIPPSYAGVEPVPGYRLDYSLPPATITARGGIAIFDRRYSDARMSLNNNGFTAGFINTPSGWVYDYYSKALGNAKFASLYIRQWSLDGGNNQKAAALRYADKTTWASMAETGISHSLGQHVNLVLGAQQTSIGDYTAVHNLVQCFGGYNSEGDLGCHAVDNTVLQGNVEYSGTLTGAPTGGATSLTVSPIQGAYTQGAGRFLVNMTEGFLSAGTIAAIARTNNTTAVTGSETDWPVSAVIAQLGTNVNSPGAVAVTPSNFDAGSLSGVQTSSLICVADQESFEMVYPTAITATSFTATFVKPHPSNAIISTGGMCGYLLDLTADDVTDATYPNKSQSITGVLHFAWPVIWSTSTTSLNVWVAGGGGFQTMVSRWSASKANRYVLYRFAEVISTQQAGTVSDTLTVGPNRVDWRTGDTVSEFLYPAEHVHMGNSVVESYYPNVAGTNGFSLTYNLPLQDTDAMLSLSNNGPTSIYSSNGGTLPSPIGMHISGPTDGAFTTDMPADQATIGVGCVTPCTASNILIAAANAAYYDFFSYDAGSKQWGISANVNSGHYYFGGNLLRLPFSDVALANDPNARGYVAAPQIRSAIMGNSDSSGELIFNGASSSAQALKGSHASHVECSVRPQFDMGLTNRHWVTYSDSSFTVNFAAPVRGTVSYNCAARD